MGIDVAATTDAAKAPARVPHRQHRPVRAPDRARGADLLRPGPGPLARARSTAADGRGGRASWPSSRCSIGAARGCRPGRSSGCRWRGRCCTIRRCWCSTSRPTASTCWPAAFCASWCRPSAKRGKAVIFSTHYLAEAELLCDRIGLHATGAACCARAPGRSCAMRRPRQQPGGGVPGAGGRSWKVGDGPEPEPGLMPTALRPADAGQGAARDAAGPAHAGGDGAGSRWWSTRCWR